MDAHDGSGDISNTGPEDAPTLRVVDDIDRQLARAWKIFIDDPSDETDDELGGLLPQLVSAGYIEISGESPTGHFWKFTPAAAERANALGLD
jgi:hypothetical protein